MPSLLQHSAAEIIQQLLIDIGEGADPVAGGAWPIYSTTEPSSPDDVVTVKDTVGTDDGRSMDSEIQEHPGWQIRVRSTDHTTGWQKINAIREAIRTVGVNGIGSPVTIDGVNYIVYCLTHIGRILILGKDNPNTKRSLFTLNGTIAVDQLN